MARYFNSLSFYCEWLISRHHDTCVFRRVREDDFFLGALLYQYYELCLVIYVSLISGSCGSQVKHSGKDLVVTFVVWTKFDFCAHVISWMWLYQTNELSASSHEGLFSMHFGALEITFFVSTKFVLMRCYAGGTNSYRHLV